MILSLALLLAAAPPHEAALQEPQGRAAISGHDADSRSATKGQEAGGRNARFALASEPTSFDPLAAETTANQVIQRQVYEGLVEYDYLARPYRVTPLLAESWSVAEDGRRWRFELRPDALFHDPQQPPLWPGGSRPVLAQDVLESWLRMADARLPATGYWAMQGLIEGLDEFHRQTAGTLAEAEAAMTNALEHGLPGLRVLGPRRLEVRLTRPDRDFLLRLASAYFAVYPAETVARGINNQPVGSGPFLLAEWIPRSQAVFRAVPGWRGQTGPGGRALPQLDEVRFTTILENSTRTLMFRRGEIDRLPPLQDAFHDLIDGRQPSAELREQGVSLQILAPAGLTMIAFNMDDPQVGSIPGDLAGNRRRRLLRQAIARAYPFARWHRIIRNDAWAEAATTFIPPGFSESVGMPSSPYRTPDLDEARRLLAAAGWPGGAGAPRLQYELSGTDPVSQASGEIFAEGMRAIGLEVDLVPNTFAALQAKAARGEAQIFARGWTMDWADPANLLELFYGPNRAPGINRCNYDNPVYDRLLEALPSASAPRRRALVHVMLGLLNEELPAIPIDHRRGYMLVQPWLRDMEVHPFDPFACKYYRIER